MLAQLVVSELRTQAEEAGAPMPTVDFANSDAPDRCIHYDWDLPAPGAEVDSVSARPLRPCTCAGTPACALAALACSPSSLHSFSDVTSHP